MNISNKFSIVSGVYRPIVELLDGGFALLDSGAQIPVWVDSAKGLKDTYPDALIDRCTKACVTGFGGKSPCSPVVIIPKLRFVGVDLSIHNVAMSFNEFNIGRGIFKMILPFSIFRNGSLSVSFRSDSKIESVTYMNLSGENIYVCRKIHKTIHNSADDKKFILEGVHCLTQEEVLAQGNKEGL